MDGWRSSVLPDLAESLLFLRKKRDIFLMLQDGGAYS
jgi:hypothetical protein